jgi:hypothetical protein
VWLHPKSATNCGAFFYEESKRSANPAVKTTNPRTSRALENRIAARCVFESRIRIRLQRDGQKVTVQAWARDLSEGGLSAFVAEGPKIGDSVTLEIALPTGRETIAARVARQLGTQYGFQFTALSAEQRVRIRSLLGGQPAISHSKTKR